MTVRNCRQFMQLTWTSLIGHFIHQQEGRNFVKLGGHRYRLYYHKGINKIPNYSVQKVHILEWFLICYEIKLYIVNINIIKAPTTYKSQNNNVVNQLNT